MLTSRPQLTPCVIDPLLPSAVHICRDLIKVKKAVTVLQITATGLAWAKVVDTSLLLLGDIAVLCLMDVTIERTV